MRDLTHLYGRSTEYSKLASDVLFDAAREMQKIEKKGRQFPDTLVALHVENDYDEGYAILMVLER